MTFKLYLLGFINFCICIFHSEGKYYYSTLVNGQRNIIDEELSLDKVEQWQATLSFQEKMNTIGWDLLAVRSNPRLDDEQQMYEAGFLEGYVTQKQIEYSWINTFSEWKNKTLKQHVEEFAKNNTKFINEMTSKNKEDRIWYQTFLTYKQIAGIHAGYTEAVNKNGGQQLNFHNILSLTHIQDLYEVVNIFQSENITEIQKHMGHCSSLIRLLPDFTDIFIAHDTWSTYSVMNRMIKKYTLAVHTFNSTNQTGSLVPSIVSTFSGYPGSVSSVDDFYILSSGLITTETTNSIYYRKAYDQVKAGSQVLEGIRSITANRIATTPKEWVQYYSLYNSGTYNNQWMIIDLKLFKPGIQPGPGFFWLVESIPAYVEAKDITNDLITDFFFSSYNTPHFEAISNGSGNTFMDKMYQKSQYFNYDHNARAMIFKREAPKTNDLSSLLKLMRLNDYKTEPYSNCTECVPQQLPSLAIASRGDLYQGKAVKPFSNQSLFGAIDCKITSWSLFIRGEFLAVSGPTTNGGDLPPFSWSKSGSNKSHLGQPDVWNFNPVMVAQFQTNKPVMDFQMVYLEPLEKLKASLGHSVTPFIMLIILTLCLTLYS